MHVKRLTERDLSDVLELQALCYPADLLESFDSYSVKLAEFPQGCLGCFSDSNIDRHPQQQQQQQRRRLLVAYVFSIPWIHGHHYALNCEEQRSVDASEPNATLYIHDVAVHPDFRKCGIVTRFMDALTVVALENALHTFTLTAVYGAAEYWATKWGFTAVGRVPYGLDSASAIMIRNIRAIPHSEISETRKEN
eukprot:ANDGO_04434.mRNA.1 hypothetical protein